MLTSARWRDTINASQAAVMGSGNTCIIGPGNPDYAGGQDDAPEEAESLERRRCHTCGETWDAHPDDGPFDCPHCDSEDTDWA